MPAAEHLILNPEGLDEFDPMEDPEFAASVQAYSDRLRDLKGRSRIDLLNNPDRPAPHAGQDNPGGGTSYGMR